MNLNELARELNVLEKSDISTFQRRARVLQSIWREEQGFACGEHRHGATVRPLGSRLPMPWAQETLANFITARIREIVHREVCDPRRSAGKLYAKPRIFNDLLSSQPLCFNLFGELCFDLGLASGVIDELTGGRFTEVRAIHFEHSPGRRDSRYTGDRSAFDVFLECQISSGQRGFIGIEVKYHEHLLGAAGEHRARYDEIAGQMGCFATEATASLRSAPLQQIWRDHLLTGITQDADGYQDAVFVLLYPRDNAHVRDAIKAYQACLTDAATFTSWTLEDFTSSLCACSTASWISRFSDRYLAFEKLDKYTRAICKTVWPAV
jgi:hypothetical protein